MAVPVGVLVNGAMAVAPSVLSHFKDKQAAQQQAQGGQRQPGGYEQGPQMSMGMSMAAGAVGAAGLEFKENGLGRHNAKEMVVRAGLGAVTGMATMKAHQAIQADGGGLKAGAWSALAGAASSGLKDGGPGPIGSALKAGMAGYGANAVHDTLTDKGQTGLADTLSGSALGGALGHTTMGSMKGTLGGAAVGGVGGLVNNHLSGMAGGAAAAGISSQMPSLPGMEAAEKPGVSQMLAALQGPTPGPVIEHDQYY